MKAVLRRSGRVPSLRLLLAVPCALTLAGCWVDVGTPDEEIDPFVVDVNQEGTIAAARFPFGMAPNDAYVVDADGEWTSLGELRPGSSEFPTAINDDGTVVGLAFLTDPEVQPDGFHVPFVWDDANGMRPLMDYPPSPEWRYTEAMDISDSGDVVGTRGDDSWHMDLATGDITILAAPSGYTTIQAWAVNDAGVIAGTARAGDAAVPTVWAPPTYQPVTLDILGAEVGSADDIDNDSTVAGTLWRNDTATAAYWDPGTFEPHELTLEGVEYPYIGGIDDGTIIVGGAIWDIPTGTFDQLAPKDSYLSAIDGPHIAGTLRKVLPDGSLEFHVGRWDRPTYD
jgi:hypothetical protein